MSNEVIDRNNNQPLYKQVEAFILGKIRDNTFGPGEIIPTERKLCKDLDVSRHTVRKAIQELVHEGYLYRVQGSGTFVFDKETSKDDKSKYIGVILADITSELEMMMLNGVERGIKNEGYKMTFMNSQNDYKKESEGIQEMKNEGVEGIIIMPAEDQEDSTAIFDLKEEQYPFVLVDRKLPGCDTDAVVSDNIDGTYKATEHLIKLGHEKICFIKNKFDETSSIKERIVGYKKALKEYAFNKDDELIYSYDHDQIKGEKRYNEIYNFIKANNITAVVAMNDFVALEVVKMCRKKKISIPDELSLVGFDNRDITEHLEVPLTTVTQFPEKIGFHAARLLVNKIKTKDDSILDSKMVHQIYYPTKLVIRESSSKLNQ